MDSTTDHDGPTFLDYVRPVWRHKLVVGVVVALAAIGTYVYANRHTRIYEASTELYVGQSALEQLLDPAAAPQTDRFVTDQARLLTTAAVATAVRSRLRLTETPEQLLHTVGAAADTNQDFVTISAHDPNPVRAARIADMFATVYLQQRRLDLVRGAGAALVEARRQLSQAGAAATPQFRATLQGQIATLESDVVAPPSPGEQITPAAAPAAPVSPRPLRDAVFAAIVGLLLAVIGAYVVERNDRRLRGPDEIETLFDVPVLATVPRVRRSEAIGSPLSRPAALRESSRRLRVNLDLARGRLDAKTILVTSALPAEGKSTVVRSLAFAYAETGARVMILEADLRRPVLAEALELDPDAGLADVLASGGRMRIQTVATGLNGGSGAVDVMVAGSHHDNPSGLLTGSRMPALVGYLADRYDVVVIDSTPVLTVGDSLPLLEMVDGVVLVVRSGITTMPDASRLHRILRRLGGVHVLGIVLNDVRDELGGDYRATPRARREPAVGVSDA